MKCCLFFFCFSLSLLCFLAQKPVSAQTNYFPQINDLRMDLWRENYDALEKKLSGMEHARGNETKNGITLNDFFEAFALNNIQFEAKISNWVLDKDSDVSLLARCAYYHNMGWKARGGKFVKDTSKNNLENMAYYFKNGTKDCRKVLARGTHNEHAYIYMIKIAQAMGNKKYVNHYGREGLKHNPNSKLIARAFLFGKLHRWGGSLAEVQAVAHTLPDTPEMKFEKYGFVDYYKAAKAGLEKRPDRAMVFLLSAIKKGGPDAFTYTAIADNFWHIKSYDDAIEYYLKAIDLWPYNASRYYQLSRLYEVSGQKKKAYEAILKAYELQTTNKKYDKLRMWLAKSQ